MKKNLNRSLTLHHEGVRHPFRLSLPLEALSLNDEQISLAETAKQPRKRLSEDASLFLLSFSAFFTAFYLFIF
ncbi:hypothetical protein [Sphingorhabdus sp. EL138]|uniref:hypothetical protein n=1 Tax=Sphingorhabdus sp. EL138 TaxID=2073156 RepID=UPI0020B116BB|nr:hypothetical protein [Sphingorhabdus sp. EL138]